MPEHEGSTSTYYPFGKNINNIRIQPYRMPFSNPFFLLRNYTAMRSRSVGRQRDVESLVYDSGSIPFYPTVLASSVFTVLATPTMGQESRNKLRSQDIFAISSILSFSRLKNPRMKKEGKRK